jgi:hypothetical protein
MQRALRELAQQQSGAAGKTGLRDAEAALARGK